MGNSSVSPFRSADCPQSAARVCHKPQNPAWVHLPALPLRVGTTRAPPKPSHHPNKTKLTIWGSVVILSYRNEHDVHQTNDDGCTGPRLPEPLAGHLPFGWRRGNENLKHLNFPK